MVEYALIIFMYAGMLSPSDSVAMNNVSGFQTKQLCEEAGKQTVSEFKNFGFKGGKFVCVRTK
jgi:hypothetical protein